MLDLRLSDIECSRTDPGLLELYIGPSFAGEPVSGRELDTFRGCLRRGRAPALLDWWQNLAADGKPPEKRTLNIREMAPFLPHIALIDCDMDDNARVHLAGSEIETLIGQPVAGRKVALLSNISAQLRQVFRHSVYRHDCVRYSVRTLDRTQFGPLTIGVLELPVLENNDPDSRLVLVHLEALN